MDGNPIKKRKEKVEDPMKKPKPAFSKGTARAVLGVKGDPDIAWLEMAVEDLCRSRSLPLQLKSNDFMRLLGTLFEAQDGLKILEQLRTDYARTHPFSPRPKEADFDFLKEVESDDGDTSEH